MEKLNNVRNYNEFKDSLNEELLWGAIKNLFSKIFAKIDKKLADSIANFTKKLDGSKTWQDSIKLYEEAVRFEQNQMVESIKTVAGPLGVRKVLADNCIINYVQLQELSNKYQSGALAAKAIFANREGNMFNFDNSDQFNNNLMQAMNAKVLELGKVSGYKENELTEYLKNNTNMEQVQQAATGETTSYSNFSKSEKLFEEVDNKPIIPTGDLAQLKNNSQNWLTNNIYGYALEAVKKVPQPANAGAAAEGDAIDKAVAASKATTLHGSLSNLLKGIINIPDKNTLIKIRDILATSQGKTPQQMKDEMPF